jgi:hypothetical protein
MASTVGVVEALLGLLGSKTFLVVNVLLQQASRMAHFGFGLPDVVR